MSDKVPNSFLKSDSCKFKSCDVYQMFVFSWAANKGSRFRRTNTRRQMQMRKRSLLEESVQPLMCFIFNSPSVFTLCRVLVFIFFKCCPHFLLITTRRLSFSAVSVDVFITVVERMKKKKKTHFNCIHLFTCQLKTTTATKRLWIKHVG